MADIVSTAVLTVRLEPALKQRFVAAAERDAAGASEVLRSLIADYVGESQRRELRRQLANVRANADDEREAMNWIAVYADDA